MIGRISKLFFSVGELSSLARCGSAGRVTIIGLGLQYQDRIVNCIQPRLDGVTSGGDQSYLADKRPSSPRVPILAGQWR